MVLGARPVAAQITKNKTSEENVEMIRWLHSVQLNQFCCAGCAANVWWCFLVIVSLVHSVLQCKLTELGTEYRGTLDITKRGYKCKPWAITNVKRVIKGLEGNCCLPHG